MISVLVVDDSALMRKMVTEILSSDENLRVVGQARDGAEALKKLEALQPDVVTLDVEMPVMDGYAALTEIMRLRPTPVLMLSSLTQSGADATLRCLELGAIDFIGKPSGAISLDLKRVSAELIAKVKVAAGAKVRTSPVLPLAATERAVKIGVRKPGQWDKTLGVLAIGASTGGPRALQTLVPSLPADLGVPIVIVQHMPPGFTAALACRLNNNSPFLVREAQIGDQLLPGVALVAPGGYHLEFDECGRALLTQEPPIHGVRPAVDVTLTSLARLYGPRTAAVLLTGMGRDGARGLKTIFDRGGKTLVENEATCVIYGMPKAAIDMGAAEQALPLPELAPAIVIAVQACLGSFAR